MNDKKRWLFGTLFLLIGFALGVERLIELLRMSGVEQRAGAEVFVVYQTPAAVALKLAESLRDRLPRLRLGCALAGGSFKAQFKRADRSGAAYAVVLGEAEIANGQCQIKDLRGSQPQELVSLEELPARLDELLSASRAS